MSTRAEMIAEFKQDTFRNDTDIEALAINAIRAAIRQYRVKRFYFNETLDAVFNTVSGKFWYAKTDLPQEFPLFIKYDAVFAYDNGRAIRLDYMAPERIVDLTDNSTARGTPYGYSFYNRSLGIYPVPERTYQIRVMGHIDIPPPAANDEPDNPWMTDAYYLILRAAERIFAANMTGDVPMAQMAGPSEQEALQTLYSETGRMVGTDTIEKTEW